MGKEVKYVGFDKTGGSFSLVEHTFKTTDDGLLVHEINGSVRAIVPPEGFKGYAEVYPNCQPVIDSVTKNVYTLDKEADKNSSILNDDVID